MIRILPILAVALTLLGFQPAPASAAKAKGEQAVTMTVTRNGFEPALVHLKVGVPVRLVVTRKVQRTCATDIVIKDLGIKKALPLDKPVVITFTPKKAGSIRYACAMDMIAGSFVVE